MITLKNVMDIRTGKFYSNVKYFVPANGESEINL